MISFEAIVGGCVVMMFIFGELGGSEFEIGDEKVGGGLISYSSIFLLHNV